MTKRLMIPPKPGLDQWVTQREETPIPAPSGQSVKMKRLTLDIPEALHRAIKMQAAETGVTMAEQLRTILEQYYRGTPSPDEGV
jgi:predicted DNA binding CopG/RHH family protein